MGKTDASTAWPYRYNAALVEQVETTWDVAGALAVQRRLSRAEPDRPWAGKPVGSRSARSSVEVPIQVNGRLQTIVDAEADATDDDRETAARAHDRITAMLAGACLQRVVVPGRS